jgi:hypothetical protein
MIRPQSAAKKRRNFRFLYLGGDISFQTPSKPNRKIQNSFFYPLSLRRKTAHAAQAALQL